jgi:hypothetical protein
MANTYQLIESKTLGSSAASVTFSSIPGTYTDLLLKISARDSSTASAIGSYYTIAFNGGSSYSALYLQGTASTVLTGTLAQLAGITNTSATTSNTFNNDDIYIPNYTSTSDKSYSIDSVTENNSASSYLTLVAGKWSGGAVTSITLTPSTGNFVQYSNFYLYGIKNS